VQTSEPLWLLESADGTSGPVSGGAAVGAAGGAEWTQALATPQDSVGFTLAVRAGVSNPVPRGDTVPGLVDHQTSAETSDTVRHELAADALEVAEGDLLIAHVCVDGGRNVDIACPLGWVRELTEQNSGVAGALCTRLADASDANAASFEVFTSRPEQSQSGLLVVSGPDLVAPVEASSARADQHDASPVSPALPDEPQATSVVLRFMCADAGRATEGEGFPAGMARHLWLLETEAGQSGPVTGGAALDQPGAYGGAEWTDALAANLRSVNFTLAVRTAHGGPVANAGVDVSVDDEFGDGSENILLDGSSSYAPNGTLVAWTWTNGATELGTGETLVASFPVGSHSVSLHVEGDRGNTATDGVLVTVVSNAGQPPLADAGPDQTVPDLDGNGLEEVTLDGSGSFDPDGSIVDWTWTEGASELALGEVADVSLEAGIHTLTLTVRDDEANAASDTLDVEVQGTSGSTCRNDAADPLTLYHIGHSLTDRAADLLNSMLETESGQSVSYSYKSIPGTSLYHHWQAPRVGRKGNIRSGDAFQILHSGQFDALVLTESTSLDYFVGHSSHGSPEYANRWVDEFLASTTRPNPRVFIYSTWWGREPGRPDTPESIATFLSEIERRQPLWESIAQSVRDSHPGLPVHIIPGGLVLKELQERVLAGTLALPGGATFRDTFFKNNRPSRSGGCGTRDHIHLSETGIYAIALTHHAVIHGACVEGFPASIPYPGYNDGCVQRDSIDVDPGLALEIQRVITEVVNGYSWTGL